MKTNRIVVLLVASASLLALVAWSRIYVGTPYNGVFWLSSVPNGLRSNLRNVVWDTAGVDEIRNNWHFEEYDQTADCVNSPKVGDKLRINYAVTTMPNNGVYAYNDCDGPGPDVNEEVELALNPSSVAAGTKYQYDLVWTCNGTNISGEVNVTFEYSNIYRDWNTKSQYWGWCGGSAQLSNPVADEGLGDWNSGDLSPEQAVFYDSLPGDSSVRYEVLRTSAGQLRARSRVNFLNSDEFQNYRRFNNQLLASMKTEPSQTVFAVITLWQGISGSEFASLIAKTGLQIISYGIVGKNADGQQVLVYVWPTNDEELNFPNEQGVHYQGVYTFTALAALTALDILVFEPSTALVDVSANKIASDISAKLGESINVTQIGIPNPSWYIASGELKAP